MSPAIPAHLGGESLNAGHIYALVHDTQDFYATLGPFIVEGMEQGDRGVHLVGDRGAHLTALRGLGIDVEGALATGQLEVVTWAESYLAGGGFSGQRMLEFVRQRLDAGRRSGYPRTRLVGAAEWVVGHSEWVPELATYEAQLQRLLRARPDILVCAYELGRHSASVIALILDAHSLVLQEGILRASRPLARVSPRERILAAADDHFHSLGIRATGVDTLIEAAGVAKATFYRQFASKDDLVVAWLEDTRPRWLYPVRATVEAAGRPAAERILAVFEESARWHEQDGFRGCAFQNAAIEITDSTHPAWPVIRGYLDEVEAYFRLLVAEARQPDPEAVAAQLAVLLSGALALCVARRSVAPMLAARDAAEALMSGADWGVGHDGSTQQPR